MAQAEVELRVDGGNVAIGIQPDRALRLRRAAMRRAGKVFHAGGLPAQRRTQVARGVGQHQLLRPDGGLAAEGTAHVGCNHMHLRRRHVQRCSEHLACALGGLGGQPGLQTRRLTGVFTGLFTGLFNALPVQQRRAWLQRAGRQPRCGDAHTGSGRRGRQRALGVAHAGHGRCIGGVVGLRRQFIDVGPHQVGRRLRGCQRVRHHQRQRRAHGQHVALCKWRAGQGRAGQGRDRQQRIHRRHHQPGQIGRGKHRHHARQCPRRRHVDTTQPTMGMGTAHEHRVQHARRVQVTHKAAFTAQQANVFTAPVWDVAVVGSCGIAGAVHGVYFTLCAVDCGDVKVHPSASTRPSRTHTPAWRLAGTASQPLHGPWPGRRGPARTCSRGPPGRTHHPARPPCGTT